VVSKRAAARGEVIGPRAARRVAAARVTVIRAAVRVAVRVASPGARGTVAIAGLVTIVLVLLVAGAMIDATTIAIATTNR
jgi:hypothetical protein